MAWAWVEAIPPAQRKQYLGESIYPFAQSMHPDDAARRGLPHGADARVRSATGELVATVAIDDALRPGVVSLPHGFAAPAIGALTTAATGTDPRTGMVHQSGFRVTVDAAPAS